MFKSTAAVIETDPWTGAFVKPIIDPCRSDTIMDVGAWLRGLGLGQYETTFRESEIDAEVLPDLTEGDLNQLGVPLGHRKRLLKAIAALGTPETDAKPPKPASPKGPEVSAERRPITVMFCDLVGSTSMAAKLDAEDWRTLVNTYLDEASAAVTGLGGHVLKKLGDGLMALFGYPHAQENDAERAVRAALAIQRALVEINARSASRGAPELQARIGLDSGQVVVDATGEVFGDAPNIAARAQAEAEPGSVLITLAVQRQVAGLFVAEEQSTRELKGVSQPVQLFRVVRASGGGRKGGARALTPFVGREEELGLLTRRWERARAGEGQLVLIVGEPGLGKSRLIEEFHSGLAETPHTWSEWSASQLLQNTPLHPIAEWGRLRFGADAPAEQRLADLEGTLRLIGLDPAEHAPLLAPLVDIPLPPDRATNLPPEELRRRQLAAMTAWVLAGARSQPLVLGFEDLHWADPTSLDLLRALADRGAQAPLLVLATTRPEFRAPWNLRSHHSLISLSPLDRAGVARMVGEISARHALSKELIEGVNERTGGVPLFVEEVTRLLVERGAQGGVQSIPPTLQQSLAARLDRLGPAREVAQVGAVLGRDFVYALLRDVAGLDESALQPALERLTEADLLFVEGAPPEANYRFKHALIQDAAYDSLLKSRRQALHRRAAEALVEAKSQPEAIAHHFTQAGLDDLAIEWWGKAGDQALRRSAFQEAIAHLGKAIEMADRADRVDATGRRVTRGPAAPSKRLTQMQVAYGNALLAARGQGAPETTAAFARARESASGDKDAPERLAADYGLWVGSYTRGELPSMRTHAAAFLSDVAARPDSSEAGVAHRAAGTTCWFAGEYREAQDHLERALALFQPGRDDDLAFRFGADPGVGAMAYLATALWPLGEVDRAVSLIDRMQTRIVDLTHVVTLAVGGLQAALFELMRGDQTRAAPNALELARLARENDLSLFRAYSVFLEGWVTAASGVFGSGLEHMRRGVELLREQNVQLFDGLLKIALAEAEARAGDPDRALAVLDEALATSDRTGNRAFEAELHRARGDALLMRDPANSAPVEEAFLTAISVAKQQGTRSFELRAALSLAKRYHSASRLVDAYAVLAAVLEGFSATSQMLEFAEAQALLAALGEMEELKAADAQRRRRLHLQTAYGQAMMWAKGFASEESKAAFSRATELTVKTDDFADRFAAGHFQWTLAFVRGELQSARELESSFLKEAEETGLIVEAGIARRGLVAACYQAGDFVEARMHCERALEACDTVRDRESQERFHDATGPIVMSVLAVTMWQLGEVGRARDLIEQANRRASDLGHAPSMTHPLLWKAHVEILRRDAAAALAPAEALADLGRELGLPFWRTFGELSATWARGRLHDTAAGAADLRRALAERVDQGGMNDVWFYTVLLAELEADTLGLESALARIDEAVALARQVENRCNLAFPHLLRGELLLKRDPTNPAPAEEAFQTALAIAKEQSARSWGLRAALSLAKLYQSTGRPAEAHGVLAPALEDFSPTTEMPEIEEAQALLAALAEKDEVKAEAARREQRLRLESQYAEAVGWSKGFAAEETKAAFDRVAHALTTGSGANSERTIAPMVRWATTFMRGEIDPARQAAENWLRAAEEARSLPEIAAANRNMGATLVVQGNLAEAEKYLQEAMKVADRAGNLDPAGGVGSEPAASAAVHLSLACWIAGEPDRSRALIEDALARSDRLAHVPTQVVVRYRAALYEMLRGDARSSLSIALSFIDFCRARRVEQFLGAATAIAAWARARLGDPACGRSEYRETLTALSERGHRLYMPYYLGRLAELDLAEHYADAALSALLEAQALAQDSGQRVFDGFLERLRGEVLLAADRANAPAGEAAFLSAIEVSGRQGARSFALQAAVVLGKLYQSTGRLLDAQAVLAPALEGFMPTDEMPEIAEAQALLAVLEETGEVKVAEAQRERRLHLQTAYSQAIMFSKGFAAEETQAAFAHAADLAATSDNFSERFAAAHGQWTFALVGGEQRRAREMASTFLREAEDAGYLVEAGVARRGLAIACYETGDFLEARAHCERALAACDQERDRETRERFSEDTGITAMSSLALTMWQLGEVERARELIDEANRRARELGHAPSMAQPLFRKSYLEFLRGDPAAALKAAETLERICREHGLPFWRAIAELFAGWARGRLQDAAAGAAELQRVSAAAAEMGPRSYAWFRQALLADVEAQTIGAGSALERIDDSLAMVRQVDTRCELPFPHLLRGKILLERDRSNPTPAEEAFQTALAIAKQQGARSWGLRAALSLAKLYQSTGRLVDAQPVLAPALEGFAPTPDMPEIAEAQALLLTIEAGGHVRPE